MPRLWVKDRVLIGICTSQRSQPDLNKLGHINLKRQIMISVAHRVTVREEIKEFRVPSNVMVAKEMDHYVEPSFFIEERSVRVHV